MASSTTVYMNGAYDEPVAAHHNFQTDYNLDDPLQAMNSYTRVMHQHTKRQMDSATRSSRRRSPNGVDATGSLANDSSQNSRTSVGAETSAS